MKEFFQKQGETIVANGDIYVRILEIHDDEVVLAIDAPEWMAVGHAERHEEVEDGATLLPR